MSNDRQNAGFVITNAIHVGNKEFVLGVNMQNVSSFVTWECKEGTDYFWGNYTNCLLTATKDLCERVIKEIEYLEQRETQQQKDRRDAVMEIRPMTQEERKYTYQQSMQLQGQTGSIGHLRGDFGKSGREFYHTWSDHWKKYKTEDFHTEIDGVINALRSEEYKLLAGRREMAEYAKKFPDSAFPGNCGKEYGFRVNTEKYAYLIRCNPSKGDYNFYCYCYVSEQLDRHMDNARQGIRFIEPDYKEKFRIPDGGKIVVTTTWGEKVEKTCRFIDEYHTEVGSQLYHICQFAELMQKNEATYEPKPEEAQKAKGNRKQER